MEISIADAHNRLSYWLKYLHQGPLVITRRGKPIGVIIDPIDYENLRQVQAYIQMISLAEELNTSGVTAAELRQAAREELELRT